MSASAEELRRMEDRLVGAVDGPRMMWYVRKMTSWHRHAGTAAELEAFRWLEDVVRDLGYRTELVLHDAYISLPGPAAVEALGRRMKCIAHSFSRPSPEGGLRAPLVYAGAGRPADYDGVDARGRIVVLEGVANPAATLEAGRRGAVGQIHISPHEHLHEMCISPVWGSPHDEQLDRLPRTVVVSVCREEGDRLKEALAAGRPVEAVLHAQVDTGWRRTPILFADLPGRDPDRYILLSGHYDSWYEGAMDNGGANATMLEVARLCAQRREHWRWGLKLAFWSGHSQGRYSSSAWWADHAYEEIHQRCLVHVNVDSTGGRGNTVVSDTAAAAELGHLAEAVLRDRAGQPFSGRRMQRAGDQSFWGIGVPSIFGNMSEQPATPGGTNPMAAVFGGEGRRGQGTGWWWHTPHDTFDKMDEAILVRDTAIYVAAVWRLLTDPVLPLRFEAAAAEIRRTLSGLADAAGGRFDLSVLLERAERLEQACARLSARAEEVRTSAHAGDPAAEAAADRLNRALQDLSRCIVPICYNAAGPFEQDPALGMGPVPALAPVVRFGELNPDSDEFKHLEVRMARARNRVAAALAAACRRAEQAVDEAAGSGPDRTERKG